MASWPLVLTRFLQNPKLRLHGSRFFAQIYEIQLVAAWVRFCVLLVAEHGWRIETNVWCNAIMIHFCIVVARMLIACRHLTAVARHGIDAALEDVREVLEKLA